mmetsp:Transcript_20373/g.70581  ORF Transcript_20373/g.70581 Transcript_20373/m.70581 type:complete len:221 (-) Transcript_20373:914-1576(-)
MLRIFIVVLACFIFSIEVVSTCRSFSTWSRNDAIVRSWSPVELSSSSTLVAFSANFASLCSFSFSAAATRSCASTKSCCNVTAEANKLTCFWRSSSRPCSPATQAPCIFTTRPWTLWIIEMKAARSSVFSAPARRASSLPTRSVSAFACIESSSVRLVASSFSLRSRANSERVLRINSLPGIPFADSSFEELRRRLVRLPSFADTLLPGVPAASAASLSK